MAVRVIEALGRAGYEVQGSYVPIHLLQNSAAVLWDPLPQTDRVWADLVELPCEPEISLASVKKIAAIVKATTTQHRRIFPAPQHSVADVAIEKVFTRRNAEVCANQQ